MRSLRPPGCCCGLLLVALLAAGCAAMEPEIVAIEYLRSTRNADSDDAVALLDLDEIVERVTRDVVIVNTDGDPDTFMRDSVETMLWGLFQETPREEGLTYDATPANVNGNRATVRVMLHAADGSSRRRTVHLRNTDQGWRVSGRSVDHLVDFVIQRLEERY